MKTFTLLLLACGMGLGAYAQNTYTLTGELTADSRKSVKQLFLSYEDEMGRTLKLDSAKVKRGKFTFEGTVPAGVEKVCLTGFPDGGELPFFLDAAALNVTDIDARAPEKARVTGSHNNEVYNSVKELEARSLTEAAEKVKAYEASLPAEVKADPALTKRYVDAARKQQEELAHLDVLDFIVGNMYEPIAVWLVDEYARDFFSPYTLQRDVLAALPAPVRNHPLYQEMRSFAQGDDMRSGVDAPVVVGLTPEGERLSSADLQGKYLIVNFWSSADDASVAEVAHVKKALEAAREFGRFAVLSYSLDTDSKAWTDAIARLGMTEADWHNASALMGMNSKAAQIYKVKKLPYTVLINPTGRIIALELQGDALVKKVTRIAAGIESYE